MIKLHMVSPDLLISLVVGETRTSGRGAEPVRGAGQDRVSRPLLQDGTAALDMLLGQSSPRGA